MCHLKLSKLGRGKTAWSTCMSWKIFTVSLIYYGKLWTRNEVSIWDSISAFRRSANQKLQDTNDGLVQMVDVSSLRSPRVTPRRFRNDDDERRSSGSDSIRSRSSRRSDRLRVIDSDYKIKRLLDDLDSGTASVPASEDAITTLDNVIREHEQPLSIEQRDCDLTEVQDEVGKITKPHRD